MEQQDSFEKMLLLLESIDSKLDKLDEVSEKLDSIDGHLESVAEFRHKLDRIITNLGWLTGDGERI